MKVSKEFDFCYGHRLSDYNGKCSNLHGHNGHLIVTISGEPINNGMVLDFGLLKEVVKKVLDASFDHKMILKAGDLITDRLRNTLPKEMVNDSFYFVDYNPTAENMARDIYEQINFAFNLEFKIDNVRLYETPTSFVDYSK